MTAAGGGPANPTGEPRRRGRRRKPDPGPPPELLCTPDELAALRRIAASQTAGVWRSKRAKIILGTLEGRSSERLMWDVRVPVRSVEAFQHRFAALRLAAFDRPDRRPTAREAAVERLLAFLATASPDDAPEWDTLSVGYIGRQYTAREVRELRTLAGGGQPRNRAELARELCRLADLRNEKGRPRNQMAQDVLKRMAMDNLLDAPPPAERPPRSRSRDAPTSGLPPEGALREAVGALRLVLVSRPEESRLWRELLRRHHYIPQPNLFGAQLRYLVYGQDGETGAEQVVALLGFAAAAWRIAGRDVFIGWSDEERVRNLKRVVNNARFLILPWIRCPNLASRILGVVARRLPGDWEARYGYRPVLLETFVQLDRFTGTCYRAANWTLVGTTAGYSVHGEAARKSAPQRAIFVYPLHRHFRRVLYCASPEEP